MTRAIKIAVDGTYEEFDLKPYPHLHEVVGSYFDMTGLTPVGLDHLPHCALAVDDEGILKELPPNRLATSLRGVFAFQNQPLRGTAVLLAADAEGENVDIPQWIVDLLHAVATVKGVVQEGIRRG